MHLPKSKTTLIQIIGRALRLHSSKTIANIILPCSTNEDGKDIGCFMKVIAQNDSRIKKSFNNKKLGGYIKIEKVKNDENKEKDDDIDVEFKYNMIYNKLGILVNSVEIWEARLEELQKYIDVNKKRPSSKDKNKKIKSLGTWLVIQVQNYKNKQKNMKNKIIYDKWTKFITKNAIYFKSNNKIWDDKLIELKDYVNLHKKRPSNFSKQLKVKTLAHWSSYQIKNYSDKKQIMKNNEIYDKWTEFMIKNAIYFKSNDEIWNDNLIELQDYINLYKKRPPNFSKQLNVKTLAKWSSCQIKNYNDKKQIMKNNKIYNKWTEFITKNEIYYKLNNKIWDEKLIELQDYVNLHKKMPSRHDKNLKIKALAIYNENQRQSYKNKTKIMKNKEFYDKWTEFIETSSNKVQK